MEFDKWDEYTCDILNRAFVYPQLHNMFKGTSSLGNIYDDNTSFKAKRARLYELLPKKIHHLNGWKTGSSAEIIRSVCRNNKCLEKEN